MSEIKDLPKDSAGDLSKKSGDELDKNDLDNVAGGRMRSGHRTHATQIVYTKEEIDDQ